MAATIEGTVVKTGAPKFYEGYTFRDAGTWKFFIEVVTDEGQHYKTMVQVEGDKDYRDREAWAYKGVGDRVRFTVHRTKDEDDEGAIWTTCVTFKQSFERLTTDGFDAWKADKDAENADKAKAEAEAKAKAKAAKKARNEAAEAARQERLDNERNDPRLPQDVASKISKTYNIPTITVLLQDLAMHGDGGIHVGQGGKIDWSGRGDWRVGTGLRRPHGALYNMPKSWRKSILMKAVEAGIIESKSDEPTGEASDVYEITDKGVELLSKIGRCARCGRPKIPVYVTSSYTFGQHGKTQENNYVVFRCPDHHGFRNLRNTGFNYSFHATFGDWGKRMTQAFKATEDVEIPDYIRHDKTVEAEASIVHEAISNCLYTANNKTPYEEQFGTAGIPDEIIDGFDTTHKYETEHQNRFGAYMMALMPESRDKARKELIARKGDAYDARIYDDLIGVLDDIGEGEDLGESPPDVDAEKAVKRSHVGSKQRVFPWFDRIGVAAVCAGNIRLKMEHSKIGLNKYMDSKNEDRLMQEMRLIDAFAEYESKHEDVFERIMEAQAEFCADVWNRFKTFNVNPSEIEGWRIDFATLKDKTPAVKSWVDQYNTNIDKILAFRKEHPTHNVEFVRFVFAKLASRLDAKALFNLAMRLDEDEVVRHILLKWWGITKDIEDAKTSIRGDSDE